MENDTSSDVAFDFWDYYNANKSLDDIKAEILSNHTYDDSDSDPDVYFALAFCQWEVGYTDEEIHTYVSDAVNNKSERQRWLDLSADEDDADERQAKLEAFLSKICSPNPSPKPREVATKADLPPKESTTRKKGFLDRLRDFFTGS